MDDNGDRLNGVEDVLVLLDDDDNERFEVGVELDNGGVAEISAKVLLFCRRSVRLN